MTTDLPETPDGNALRDLVTHGSDLSQPMLVNFQVAVPSEEAANRFAKVVLKLGYRVESYASPECSLPWTCECSSRMIATHDAIIAIQKELARLAVPFEGYPDGWGSFGNADEKS